MFNFQSNRTYRIYQSKIVYSTRQAGNRVRSGTNTAPCFRPTAIFLIRGAFVLIQFLQHNHLARLIGNCHIVHELAAGKDIPAKEIPLERVQQGVRLIEFFIAQVKLIRSEC